MHSSGRGAAEAPIGVFDSGLGGLTVVRAIRSALPAEDIVYLGDNARVPYGTRSPRTVLSYARGCARKLAACDIKFLVVACNTVSAVALDMLAVELDLPVLGVIEPGARSAARRSRNGRIGVIATAATVESGAYARAIAGANTRAEVVSQAAPLLVPLAEEGWLEGEVPRLAARRYLSPLIEARVDTLVLGCTHYPLLHPAIAAELEAMGAGKTAIVDSADATAHELLGRLEERELRAIRARTGALRLLVTDMPRHFGDVAARFLGTDAKTLAAESVDL